MSPCVESPWLGRIEVTQDSELFFPGGMPGFEEHQRILPVEIPSQRPLVYLQSIQSPEVCFVSLPVLVLDPGFRIQLTEDEKVTLDIAEACDEGTSLLCLAVLWPAGDSVCSNLGSVVLVNLINRRGMQRITEDSHQVIQLCDGGRWVRQC